MWCQRNNHFIAGYGDNLSDLVVVHRFIRIQKRFTKLLNFHKSVARSLADDFPVALALECAAPKFGKDLNFEIPAVSYSDKAKSRQRFDLNAGSSKC
jgi:hypothetical protein